MLSVIADVTIDLLPTVQQPHVIAVNLLNSKIALVAYVNV